MFKAFFSSTQSSYLHTHSCIHRCIHTYVHICLHTPINATIRVYVLPGGMSGECPIEGNVRGKCRGMSEGEGNVWGKSWEECLRPVSDTVTVINYGYLNKGSELLSNFLSFTRYINIYLYTQTILELVWNPYLLLPLKAKQVKPTQSKTSRGRKADHFYCESKTKIRRDIM